MHHVHVSMQQNDKDIKKQNDMKKQQEELSTTGQIKVI